MTEPYAFVSYVHEDGVYVRDLIEHLHRARISAWYDKDVRKGQTIDRELEQRLAGCAALIVVMSPDADVAWIHREITAARELRKPILPLLLAGKPLPALRHVLYHDVTDGGLPDAGWLADLARVMVTTSPSQRKPKRRLAFLMAVAGLLGIAVAGTAVAAMSNDKTEACIGHPARIIAVSSLDGHTGQTPDVTVTVCTPPVAGHEYWLMDYTPSDYDQLRFFVKIRIDATGSRPYRIEHHNAPPSSPRSYVVIDVPPDRAADIQQHYLANEPIMTPETMTAPTGTVAVSDPVHAII